MYILRYFIHTKHKYIQQYWEEIINKKFWNEQLFAVRIEIELVSRNSVTIAKVILFHIGFRGTCIDLFPCQTTPKHMFSFPFIAKGTKYSLNSSRDINFSISDQSKTGASGSCIKITST